MGNKTSTLAEIKKKGDAYNKAVRKAGLAHQMSSKRFKKDDPFAEQWKVSDRLSHYIFFCFPDKAAAGGSIHHTRQRMQHVSYDMCKCFRQKQDHSRARPPLPFLRVASAFCGARPLHIVGTSLSTTSHGLMADREKGDVSDIRLFL